MHIFIEFKKMLLMLLLLFLICSVHGCSIPSISTSKTYTVATSMPYFVTQKSSIINTPQNITEVKYADYPPGCEIFRTISPDLTWAVSICTLKEETGLYVWKVGQQQAYRLYQFKEPGYGRVLFSPDGSKLLMVIDNEPWWLFDVGQWQTPKILLSSPDRYAIPTWSPDSKSIAVTYLEIGWALSILKLDGTYKNLVPFETHDRYTQMTWSPDGRKIAYMTASHDFDYQPLELNMVDVESGNYGVVFTGDFYRYNQNILIWSPDGEFILIINTDEAYHDRFFLYNVDENSIAGLPAFGNPFSAIWSPNSKFICFDDFTELYILSVEYHHIFYLGPFSGEIRWKDDNSIIILQADSNLGLISWQ